MTTVTREEVPLSLERLPMAARALLSQRPVTTMSISPLAMAPLERETLSRVLDVATPTDTSTEMEVETTPHGTERSGDMIEASLTTCGDQ